MKIVLLLILILTLTSCPKLNQNGGGGDGGGNVPSATDLNKWLDNQMKGEIPKCTALTIDDHLAQRKYPLIASSGSNIWDNNYSEAIAEQFDKDYMKPLREQKLKEADLELIGCPGYNYATREEKKKFWILWLSSMAKPESNFNNNSTAKSEDPNRKPRGILQIDKVASNTWCGQLKIDMKRTDEFAVNDILEPKTNLQCGLIMMQTQILGVPLKNKKDEIYQSRPELEGSLFTTHSRNNPDYWFWSVLHFDDDTHRRQVIDWFKVHAQRQLPFCTRKEFTLETQEKDYKIELAGKLKSWTNTTADYFALSQEEPDEIFTDPNLGEKHPTKEESCDIVDDSSRGTALPKEGTGESKKPISGDTISR